MSAELEFLVKMRNETESGFADLKQDIADVKQDFEESALKADDLGEAVSNIDKVVSFDALKTGLLDAFDGLDSAKGKVLVLSGAASDLEQTTGGMHSVFKEHAATLIEWGKTAHEQAGLSRTSFNQLAAPLGAMLKTAGFGLEEASYKTIDLTKRAADMAATFGGPVEDAMHAISSLMRGESNPIEKYGVGIKQTDVNLRALADTGKESAAELTSLELANARLALLFEQTADSAGQFEREADTAGGAAERLKAKQENLRAEMGERLLPAQVAITKGFADLPAPVQTAGFLVSEFGGDTVKTAAGLAQATMGLKAFGPMLSGIAPMATTARVALMAMGTALLTPPLGIVVALVAAGVAVYVFRDEIMDGLGAAKDFVLDTVGDVRDFVVNGFNAILDFGRSNWPEIAVLISGPFAPLVLLATDAFGVRSALVGAFNGIIDFLSDIPGRAVAIGSDIGRALGNGIIDGLNELIQSIGGRELIPGNTKGPITWDAVTLPAPPLIPRLEAGLDFVPFDNFPALLHRGERVITAAENRSGGRGGVTLNVTFSGPVYGVHEIERMIRDVTRRAAAEGAFRGYLLSEVPA